MKTLSGFQKQKNLLYAFLQKTIIPLPTTKIKQGKFWPGHGPLCQTRKSQSQWLYNQFSPVLTITHLVHWTVIALCVVNALDWNTLQGTANITVERSAVASHAKHKSRYTATGAKTWATSYLSVQEMEKGARYPSQFKRGVPHNWSLINGKKYMVLLDVLSPLWVDQYAVSGVNRNWTSWELMVKLSMVRAVGPSCWWEIIQTLWKLIT